VLEDAAKWLAESIRQSTGAELRVSKARARYSPAIVIGRADAWPDISRSAGLKPGVRDAYAIVTHADRVYILGNSETAARHGVADLLRHWGFRWFAPSPRWHIVPELTTLTIDLNRVETPTLIDRRIWYAYGMRGDDLSPLMENYERWAIANRLSVPSLMHTGHSFGSIIRRNSAAFEAHPEYYAMLRSGERDTKRPINARKFDYSNPELIELVAKDRLRLLEERQQRNPDEFMVSVDPSDGEGTCHSEACQALGTTTDRVFHLANEVAKRLRDSKPEAWVGLYAYSSHRLPPTIPVEPNVYVQVAMAFNKTSYTYPELVEAWSEKVEAIGLREYYGVEAWDWGLPGRMRGGSVAYHEKWIPFYAARKVNAINAETNANWGGQMLGLHVASALMWNPGADVQELTDDFFEKAFGDAAATMRSFHTNLDASPPLRPATLLPLFEDISEAWGETQSAEIRARLVDLMSYLVYVSRYRDFELVRSGRPKRDDAYYAALKPLMEYAWRIRHRDIVHYYALARRLCNGLPRKDNRLDFYMFNKDREPVWKQGEPLTDGEIVKLFTERFSQLRSTNDPTTTYSRVLARVYPKGPDAGPSQALPKPERSAARFRQGLQGYLVPASPQEIRFGITPANKPVEVIVYSPNGTPLWQRKYSSRTDGDSGNAIQYDVAVDLPKPGTYPVRIEGNFLLHVPPATPFVFEASVSHPAWIDYSGPHYFYVPRGTSELIVDANPRLSLVIPGQPKRLDIHPRDREAGKQYAAVPVPFGTDGRVWHTTNQTRGQVSLLNIPPLLSFHRDSIFIPEETAGLDGLGRTQRRGHSASSLNK
jgi:hypothetical protein